MGNDAFGETATETKAPETKPSPEEQAAANNAQRQDDAKAFGDTTTTTGDPNKQTPTPPPVQSKPVDPKVKAAADKAAAASAAKSASSKAPTADGSDGTNEPQEESEGMKALRTKATELGKLEGQGVNSRAELAIAVATAARDGHIKAHAKSGDVAEIYREFSKSRGEAKQDISGNEDSSKAARDKSEAVQISKLRVFAKAGDPNRPFDVTKPLTRARQMIQEEAGKKGTFQGSTFNNLVIIARAHCDPKRTKGMTDKEIRAHLTPAEPDDVPNDEYWLSELNGIEKRMQRLGKGTDDQAPFDHPALDRMLNAIRTPIVELTNSIAERKKNLSAPPVSPPAGQVNTPAA